MKLFVSLYKKLEIQQPINVIGTLDETITFKNIWNISAGDILNVYRVYGSAIIFIEFHGCTQSWGTFKPSYCQFLSHHDRCDSKSKQKYNKLLTFINKLNIYNKFKLGYFSRILL